MEGFWGKDLQNERNVTLAFVLSLQEKKTFSVRLAAATCYKIYADGTFFAFGPQRAAHGFARVANYTLCAKTLVVEVYSPYVRTFCWIKQPPFFACELTDEQGGKYSAKDFTCYRLTDRVQRVQRYSYQRTFAEIYRMAQDRKALYEGLEIFPKIPCEKVSLPTLLPSYVDEPHYTLHQPIKKVESGSVSVDESAPVWRDRAHTQVGCNFDGFTIDEWEESATDEASKFVFCPNGKGELVYTTLDFGRAITGFCELKVKTSKPTTVYLIFDELLWKEAGKGENYVAFNRNTCSSVHKWTFGSAGEYMVSTFEPYTIRYACVIATDGAEVQIYQRDFENPNAMRFPLYNEDEKLQKIERAVRATFAQNATDILMDCPSRERTGWLSDSYFTSEAEFLLTGENQAEKTFLENYALADCSNLPQGMVPMCYPTDPYDTFIPNWALWYILELEKYANRWGRDEIIEKSKAKVEGLLQYFAGKENEFGLLENLDGWVFVEWSEANDADHIQGVNIPSNICYAATLKAAARLYGDKTLLDKAEKIERFIKERAYNGEFFVDNLIRNDKGELTQTGLITEVCQYYAFWFGCVNKEDYKALYEELIERLGANRLAGYKPYVGEPNAMYGLYMRIDLWMRDGRRDDVEKECKRLFYPMAERTGTLWENNNISASCNHGFASYAIKWLQYLSKSEGE